MARKAKHDQHQFNDEKPFVCTYCADGDCLRCADNLRAKANLPAICTCKHPDIDVLRPD